MSALLVLVLVVLAAPGPGRPESATRELYGSLGDVGGNRTHRALLGSLPDSPPDSPPTNATDSGPDRGLDSGSPFWDRLYWDCGKRTSVRCVQKSAFRFLKQSLGEKDVFVTDSFVFRRNHNAVSQHPLAEVPTLLAGGPAVLQNKQGDDDDEEEENLLKPGALPTVEDLTDDLYDQGVSFIKSHDVHLRLPSLLGGAEVRLSPRTFEGDGATFKISFSRPHVDPSGQDAREARLFFNKGGGGIIKKITQKLFKKKLMTSFFALLLIIKMVKIKLMFLLPLLLGVGTAKKLLLKVLLFLFPALSHLFKLCSYYHANYAKYHHHHHKIAHHHHVIPVPVPQPVPVPSPPHHGDVYSGAPPPYSSGGPHSSYAPPASGPVYGAPSGPGGHDDANPFGEYLGGGAPSAPSGPGPGYDYPAHNRNENLGVLPGNQQSNDLMAGWGLNHGLGAAPGWDDQRVYRHTPPAGGGAAGVAGGGGAAGGSGSSKRKQGVDSASPTRAPSLNDVGPIVGPTVEVAYDAFYSPLLQRMDGVFVQLGFNEEACRERLVCSMYKNPARFAPHSNLVSAELSRDPSELQKPSSLNSAVVRFYRYVQAARDGQNAKNCMLLYPACTVNTEL